jgi:dihydroorotate dehydrogenase electron transfer subunit
MSTKFEFATVQSKARVVQNSPVSSGLMRLDLRLELPVSFSPGQFAMLNFSGSSKLVFSRPFSILAVQDDTISFLYRVVGRGTSHLETLSAGAEMELLGPLGQGFPAPLADEPAVLIAGGVGLPPVMAWLEQFGRPGDHGFFGTRDGHDVPWELMTDKWQVSVDAAEGIPADKKAFHGLVTHLVDSQPDLQDGTSRLVMSCGPMPMLKAVAELAERNGWRALLSLEEHMGCGYGACKGCVVPVVDGGATDGWRNATCCQEGPVFAAESIDWQRYGNSTFKTVT